VAQLADARGQPLRQVNVAVNRRDEASLAQALLVGLLRALDTPAAPAQDASFQEALRFQCESDFFFEHRDYARSLRAAEAASALRPDDPLFQALLSRGLLQHALWMLYPDGSAAPAKVDAATLERSLALALRGSDILAWLEALPADRGRELACFHPHASLADILPRLGVLRQTLSDKERAAVDAIRANRQRCDDIRLERLRQAVTDSSAFNRYTDLLSKVLGTNRGDRFLPLSAWADMVCGLRSWADLARQYEDDRAGWSQALLMTAIDRFGPPRLHTPEEAGRLGQFWAELETHPNTVIALYGRLGTLVNDLVHGSLTEAAGRRRVREHRLHLQTILAKADLTPEKRIGVYLAATTALARINGVTIPGRVEELKELSEFMLTRGEVFAPLALANAQTFAGGSPSERGYASEFTQRALALCAGNGGKFLTEGHGPDALAAERARFRESALRLQALIPQANPKTAQAPWEKVTTLIDVYPIKDRIAWLQQPVVFEGAVWLAAVRVEGPPRRFTVQLLRIDLADGSRREGQPIAVDLRLGPANAPGAGRNLNFGVTACIHRGRYYLGTTRNGIFAFPLDGAAPEQISTATGLPSDVVQALTCLDDRLCAFLGTGSQEGYLIAWDLSKRTCAVLASSRRKERRSPFDDRPPVHAHGLLADPARNRVLLVAFEAHSPSPLNGLWAVDPQSGRLEQILALHGQDQPIFGKGSRVEGDRMQLTGACGDFTYDLAQKDNRLLFEGKLPLEVSAQRSGLRQLESTPGYRITANEFINIYGPHASLEGWVYGARPFSRRRPDNGQVEYLPTLRQGMLGFAPVQCLQRLPGRRELLLGDSQGLWLVVPREENGAR
jgi:hypothetical protein